MWGMLQQESDHLYEDFMEIVSDNFPNIQVIYSNWDVDLTASAEAVWPGATRGTWYTFLKVLYY